MTHHKLKKVDDTSITIETTFLGNSVETEVVLTPELFDWQVKQQIDNNTIIEINKTLITAIMCELNTTEFEIKESAGDGFYIYKTDYLSPAKFEAVYDKKLYTTMLKLDSKGITLVVESKYCGFDTSLDDIKSIAQHKMDSKTREVLRTELTNILGSLQ